MDKLKSHSTSFFVDQLLNISLPKLSLDEKLNKTDLHLPINQQSTSLSDSLSLISNCMTYDRQMQTLHQINGKLIYDAFLCKKKMKGIHLRSSLELF